MIDPSIQAAIMSNAPNFYTAVRNPKWVNAEKTLIECEVNFKHVGFEEWTPFCADPNDYMPYSKEIFDRAVAGEFGPIPEFVVVVEEMPDPEVLAKIRQRQAQIMGVQSDEIPGAIL